LVGSVVVFDCYKTIEITVIIAHMLDMHCNKSYLLT